MNALAPIAGVGVRAAALDDPGERARIEAFLDAHPGATPFHRPAWSLAVSTGTGQRAHMLVAEAGDAIAGLLPLTHMRSALFGSALVSAGFAVDGGILADDPAAVSALAEAAVAMARDLRCPTIDLRGGDLPAGWAHRRGVYAGFARDLPAADADILAAIPRKQRAEVRKAIGSALAVRVHRDAQLHHRVYAESVRNLGTPVFPRRLFEAMLDGFGADADILTVFDGDRPLASVLSLWDRDTVYPYWGGGTFAARAARANELMYYALMRHAVARGRRRFDFGRSKFGTGAFAYKKNWGFEPRPLVYAGWGAARDTNPMSAKYRFQVALWKRLPLAIANRLGPVLARGLG